MTRFGLSSDAYKKIKIHCPSMDEQNKICSALDLLQGTIDRLKKQAQKYNSQKRLILQELLLNSSPIEGGV
jgi:restriction endonuclease S subunit